MPPHFRALLLICTLLCSPGAWAGIVLENPLWRVDLEPATLAIRVTPAQAETVEASAGIAAHQVSHLAQSPDRIDWQWDDGAWTLSARLDQRDLALSITARDPGSLNFLRQAGSAMGKGLLWPLAEGHYVPAGDPVWQDFLLTQGEVNTSQDLSLPLWGVDHGSFTLNWLMTRPYNNLLAFSAEGKTLALAARHEFTTLEPGTPLTFMLSLGDADPLAGAKRYRQWLIDNGQYEFLSDKLRKTPEAEKLLGASHVYLWGNDLLGPDDVRNWPALLKLLRGEGALVSEWRAGFDVETRQLLSRAQPPLNRYQRTTLLRGLNGALNRKARSGWQGVVEPDMRQLAEGYGQLRAQVQEVLAEALTTTPERWGRGLSPRTFEQFKAAGLSRLWVGLGEGWEGGLWHPETVRQGVATGYLVAPYDSYETALAATENPDWTTAHLGSRANLECAIVLRGGTLKRGFQQSGHYTDPRCVRPLLEARIRAVQSQAGFNSWFLDAYATGMVFDSYRPTASLTQAENALGNIDASRWVNEQLQLPSGSEDGNATTARGILFAHGMQTPVIGWGDTDMSKDHQSPYYLGRWFPNEEPEVFFKTVPLKQPYRTVHFAAQTRLPLYQTVFHGSVITSHHWLFDSLKFSNVRAENELAQLLYNVAPLYHLSADTLALRLPVMARQDRFFRPLHQRLATQTLTDFRWLTADRLVQQTTFADGTRLLANFDSRVRRVEGQELAGHSITALITDGAVIDYRVLSPS
ncbi:glycoside hydrolase [Pseudomonas sp. SZMC_28357]|uniref:glycoside hydrolase n=1 Tax=Pseudomonas sp. SZMC_28357 TaxID=3074380 RepID=UPI0028719BF8|nr:glycoside hydrolase [Pseudomonas sp. SZMC_28357]MDR9753323.1 glycoside hydrolase [Pseudomonas sp. SZMC_28357]